jgi:hypothetical protein
MSNFSVNRLEDGVVDIKAKKENVELARCVHVDINDLGALDRLRAFAPQPTVLPMPGA